MEPVRTCVGCKQRANPSNLIRVVFESGNLVADPKKTLPGRGAWLHVSTVCLKLAIERKAFGRAFKTSESMQSAGLVHFIEQAETMLATK
jgi:predicted RNA-binding protein YlxR (DUF448 family)